MNKVTVRIQRDKNVTARIHGVRTTGGTKDYNRLTNKPTLNGVTIEGDHDSAYYHIDQTYTHTQDAASSTWVITHNLGKYPSITVVDSGGTQVLGAVTYQSENQLTVEFTAQFGGLAYLN